MYINSHTNHFLSINISLYHRITVLLDLLLDIEWEFSIRRDNNQPVWGNIIKQHYEISEKNIEPTDAQLHSLIHETYGQFVSYLQDERVQTGFFVHPLNDALIQNTLPKLKEALSNLN